MTDVAAESPPPPASTASAPDLIGIQLSSEVSDDQRLRAYLVHSLRCLGAYDPLAFKMCWVRAPAAIRQNHVLQHCRQLALALQRRDFAQFWELIDLVIWDEDLSELVDDLRGRALLWLSPLHSRRGRPDRHHPRRHSPSSLTFPVLYRGGPLDDRSVSSPWCPSLNLNAGSGVPAPASLSCWFPGHRTEIVAGQSYLLPARRALPAPASISSDEMRAYVQHVLKLDDVAI